MNLVLTIVFFVIIISLVVSIHEFGHFITAKLFKMTVNEFAIGFGKRLISKKYKGTIYSFRMIPFGGFVELQGEDDTKDPNSFRNRPFYQKAIVLVAGVVMNIFLAIVLLTIYLAGNNYLFLTSNLVDYQFNNTTSQASYYPIRISNVDPTGRSAGKLTAGDTIVQINDKSFTSYDEFSSILKSYQGKEIKLTFLDIDNYDTFSKTLTLGLAKENGAILDATLNSSSSQIYLVKYNKNISAGVSMTYDVFVYQVKAINQLIQIGNQTGNYSQLSNSVGGLPQITDQINLAVQYNALSYLIPLTAFISISLAFFNILPFPALDGGQITIALIEKLRRKKISDEVVNRVNTIGFVLLIGLAVIVNLKDIVQLGWVTQLINGIKSILGK